jgi:hypothetical protein
MGDDQKKRGRKENLTNAGKGRPPGTLNKVTREIKDAARALVEDEGYVSRLRDRLRAGKAPHMETLLFHYAYGKPKEDVGGTFHHNHTFSWLPTSTSTS